MRLLLIGIATLTLAGCQAPAPEPAADPVQVNEEAIESQLQNEQAARAHAIENEALADDADNADVDTD